MENYEKFVKIHRELFEAEQLSDIAPVNEHFYLQLNDDELAILCQDIRITHDYYNYFAANHEHIREFLARGPEFIDKTFASNSYIANAKTINVVYNGGIYNLTVDSDGSFETTIFDRYEIEMNSYPLLNSSNVTKVKETGYWLHIEHVISNINQDDIARDMREVE